MTIPIVYLGKTSFVEVYYWLTAYVHDDYWQSFSIVSLLKSVIGFGRAFIGLQFLFIPFGSVIRGVLPGNWLADEEFLVRNWNDYYAYIWISLSLVFCFVAIFVAVRRSGSIKHLGKQPKRLLALSACWLLVFSVFCFFWQGLNQKFWISQSLCLWLMFLIAHGEETRKTVFLGRKPTLVLLVGLLFTINYFGSIAFLRDKGNDFYSYKIEHLISEAQEDDLVIIGRHWLIGGYLERYSNSTVLALDAILNKFENIEDGIAYLKDNIDSRLEDGHKVLISNEAIYVESENVLQQGKGILELSSTLEHYSDLWVERGGELQEIFILGDS